ncbi:MAG: hypothetical protein K2H09_10340 [Treponemataceae bacterium]|nr:hypothetical protein [Treponemataceae bacterium]
MPMIQMKLAGSVPQEQRSILAAELGKAVGILGKPESYLMLNFEDNQDLYFAGRKLDKGAYVSVQLFGEADGGASAKMTAKICGLLGSVLGIPADAVYVSYWGTRNWGWNGGNF